MTNPDSPACAPASPLSAAGDARRGAMRDELLLELARTRTRRTMIRRSTAAAATALTVGVALSLSLVRPLGPTTPSPARAQIVETTSETLARWSVPTDPTSFARARPDPSPMVVVLLDDTALTEALAAIGRPSGVIRASGRVWLASPVTDPTEGG